MARVPLDARTADRLLAGSLAPEDVPPGFEVVAALVRAGLGPAGDDELADPRGVVRTLTDELSRLPASRPRRRRRSRLLAPPVLAALASGLAITSAGAATGNLPAPVQSAVASLAEHAGMTLPRPHAPHHAPTRHESATATSGSTPHGMSSTSASTRVPASGTAGSTGLCQAYSSGAGATFGGKADASAFAALAGAAAAAHETVDEYCKAVSRTTPPAPTQPPAAGNAATDPGAAGRGKPQAGTTPGNSGAAGQGNGSGGATGEHGQTGTGANGGGSVHGRGPVAPTPVTGAGDTTGNASNGANKNAITHRTTTSRP